MNNKGTKLFVRIVCGILALALGASIVYTFLYFVFLA